MATGAQLLLSGDKKTLVLFHTSHTLGTPDITGSENWALRASLAYYTELQYVGNLSAEMSEERQLFWYLYVMGNCV